MKVQIIVEIDENKLHDPGNILDGRKPYKAFRYINALLTLISPQVVEVMSL
jgi:hypothetical protein